MALCIGAVESAFGVVINVDNDFIKYLRNHKDKLYLNDSGIDWINSNKSLLMFILLALAAIEVARFLMSRSLRTRLIESDDSFNNPPLNEALLEDKNDWHAASTGDSTGVSSSVEMSKEDVARRWSQMVRVEDPEAMISILNDHFSPRRASSLSIHDDNKDMSWVTGS
eukprot:CAMPEP_0172489410 /NCGR_PEP_ID=MMETSP1066-20121228/19368_1 /TAXON_ID=671091 /ORGANISM="Coscinodiscus wailesii, Strain CCMP2513" /LENGTH=167 /DNA_ID=CAMNT_0013257229 /DNA_START=241 /DNA_END=741 /DNA_ORIENTATION=-